MAKCIVVSWLWPGLFWSSDCATSFYERKTFDLRPLDLKPAFPVKPAPGNIFAKRELILTSRSRISVILSIHFVWAYWSQPRAFNFRTAVTYINSLVKSHNPLLVWINFSLVQAHSIISRHRTYDEKFLRLCLLVQNDTFPSYSTH